MGSVFKVKGRKGYQVAWKDADGKWHRQKGTADKDTARQILNKLEAEAELRRRGVIDPTADRLAQYAALPLNKHLNAFSTYLEGRGSGATHVAQTRTYVEEVIGACGIKRITGLDSNKVTGYISDLRRRGKLRDKGNRVRKIGALALNKRLIAVKTFSRWLWKTARLRVDPLAAVSRLSTDAEDKRALTEDEIAELLAAAEQGPEIKGLSGSTRALLYSVGIYLALRAPELRGLTPASFHLKDPQNASVTIRGASAKSGKTKTLGVSPELAEAIAAYMAGKKDDEPLFACPPDRRKCYTRTLRPPEIHGFKNPRRRKNAMTDSALASWPPRTPTGL